MENPKTAAVERLKEANNVLVTVSANPSVDQLAGAIGMTLLLNKLGKHATAVFSGNIPSTIEFLQPEQTLEKNTDSLRDFIISLDKAKADKLRYKVEEKLVRIFITPYHTSIGQDDLEFSLGDFNVDVIVALGVHEQQDLDQAIAAHGRILHDATIIAINTQPNGSLGTISWVDEQASSLSEMLTDVGLALKSDVLDAQMSTALLTGIVAETNRFSNQKTTSATMSLSAKLMAAGANQQLVAAKLQENSDNMLPETQPDSIPTESFDSDDDEDNSDGSLRIDHDEPPSDDDNGQGTNPNPPPPETPEDNQAPEVSPAIVPDTPTLMTEPPSRGGTLTASGLSEEEEATNNPLSLPPIDTPLLSHDDNKKDDAPQVDETSEPVMPAEEPAAQAQQEDSKTLEEIEEAVDSPHLEQPEPAPQPENPAPVAAQVTEDNEDESIAEGAQPVDLDLGHHQTPSATVTPTVAPPSRETNNQYLDVTKLDEETGLPAGTPKTAPEPSAQTTPSFSPPPLVPPPMIPPAMTFGEQPLDNHEDDNDEQQPLAPL